MLRFAKLATPATAATVAVPPSVPPPGFVPSATVTVPVNPLAVLPSPSRAVTCTAGAIAAPAVVVVGCTVKTSCVAVPAVMLNAPLVAPVSPAAVTASVYPVPGLSMLSVAKFATPATAATVAVPASVPPPGLVPIATVTFPVNPLAVFPCPSRAVTCTVGVIVAPAVVVVGCTVKTSCVAVPAVMLNAPLVAPVSPAAVTASVYPVPGLSMLSVAKFATPATAATVAVPASVPPPGLVPIATATVPVNPLAVLPCASRAVTCTAGVIVAPAVVV